jgi:predicted enzyme related to lactoylglutathione lyase
VSLRRSPLLYVFFEIRGLRSQRELLETVIGLPLIEVEPHLPHHRHGAVKYDAGGLIVSLNISTPSRFRTDGSDGLVTVFRAEDPEPLRARLRADHRIRAHERGDLFTDLHGHHYVVRRSLPGWPAGRHGPLVDELRLTVPDLDRAVAFYRDVLDLELEERTEEQARFATGSVGLALTKGRLAPDGRRARHTTYLVVFNCDDVEESRNALARRGVAFKSAAVGYSEIGGTIRFDDPCGHRLCLYQPSDECLTWESGPKVIEIAERAVAR